jgi:hypothetical protein
MHSVTNLPLCLGQRTHATREDRHALHPMAPGFLGSYVARMQAQDTAYDGPMVCHPR